MNIIDAVILGIIQGLTEFLPISSTAHLTLAGKLLGVVNSTPPEDWTAFMAIMQLGTVAAVIIFFLKDLMLMTRSFFADIIKNDGQNRWTYESKLAWKIILGTIPVVIIGLAFKNIIEGTFTKEFSTFATTLIVLALFLLWAEKIGRRIRTEQHIRWKDALIVGFAQALALIPGSSRSGTTITAGLFLGLTRETAARFSFLLSIPAVLASGFYEMYQARHHFADLGIAPLIISTVVAGIVGYWSISFLLRFLQKHTTYVFIFYRIILGAVLWGLLLTKYI